MDFVLPSSQICLHWSRIGNSPFEFDNAAKLPINNLDELKSNQVLLQVYSVGLNPVDYKLTQKNFVNHTLPSVVGFDVSGIIRRIGKGTNTRKYEFKEGDAVFGHLNLSKPGALQEYVTADIDRLVLKPSFINFTDAASLGTAYLAAWLCLNMLKNELKDKLIYMPGGSGGVCSYAIQLAKLYGAKIITTASKEQSLHLLKQDLNCDYVLNYKQADIRKEIMDLTDQKGVEYVVDCTYSPESLLLSSTVLADKGKFIVLGHELIDESSKEYANICNVGGTLYHIDLGDYSMENKKLNDFNKDCIPGFLDAVKLLEQKKLNPLVSKVVNLTHVPMELEGMKMNHKLYGRIVCQIRDPVA